jgi:uncharacterized membrane protein YccC
VQGYFYALLLHPPPEHWPWLPAAIAVACVLAALVRFVLWPERPQGMLRAEVDALRAGIASLLQELALRLREPERQRDARRARASLARLNDLSLRIDQRLARFAQPADAGLRDTLRDRVLRAEIAAETLQACTATVAAVAAGDTHQRMADALRALLDAVRIDMPFDAAAWEARLAQREPVLDADRRWRFRHAAEALVTQPPWQCALPTLGDTTAAAAPPAQPRPPGPATRWRWLADQPTRQSLQAAAAALVAMLAGYAIAQEHWFWAAFGAFVIFTRAGTRGQAAAGAWKRTLGNVVGLVLGLVLAELVRGSPPVELALLFVFVFAGFCLFQVFQAGYLALLTAMLAMLYELLGMYSPGLLLTRAAEMVAGSVAGVLSAMLVLPARTQAQSDQESVALLREAAKVLRDAMAGPRAPPARDAVRDLDRRLQALRQALGPVTTPEVPAPKSGHRRRLYRLAVLVYCVRHFYALAAKPDAALADRAGRLADAIESVAAWLACEADAPQLPPIAPPASAGRADAPDPRRIAAHWLCEAGEVLRCLREEEAASRAAAPAGGPRRRG